MATALPGQRATPLLQIVCQRRSVRPVGVSPCLEYDVQSAGEPDETATREFAQTAAQAVARHGRLIEAWHDDAKARVTNGVGSGRKF